MKLPPIEPVIWIWISVLSLVLFFISIVAIYQIVIRMPADYFCRQSRRPARLPVRILRNIVGGLLVCAGIMMLFTPGQGILTILIGSTLVELPGKYRFERWLIQRPRVLDTINKWRAQAGQPMLVFDT